MRPHGGGDGWSRAQTCGSIPRLVTAEDLRGVPNGGAALVLTAAIYLRASWKTPFEMKRQLQPFTPAGARAQFLRMMTRIAHCPTHIAPEYDKPDEQPDFAEISAETALRVHQVIHKALGAALSRRRWPNQPQVAETPPTGRFRR